MGIRQLDTAPASLETLNIGEFAGLLKVGVGEDAMAKILIVGSKPAESEEFERCCEVLGSALAKGGHTIVAGSCDVISAEYSVLAGANAVSSPGRRCRVIPFAPAQQGLEWPLDPAKTGVLWPNLDFLAPVRTRGDWTVGVAVALHEADAVILLGGRDFTLAMGYLAIELGKPVFGVPSLGGSSFKIWELQRDRNRDLDMPPELLSPAADDTFGKHVLEALQFLIAHDESRRQRAKSLLILGVECLWLLIFGFSLFHGDPNPNRAKVVAVTCLGALFGAILSYLARSLLDAKRPTLTRLLGELSLAAALGMAYGLLCLHAGGLYHANLASWNPDQISELSLEMALVGIGVGALLRRGYARLLDKIEPD